MKTTQFSELKGKTLKAINGLCEESDRIYFLTEQESYLMWHDQSCCEYVRVVDICGDVNDILNSEILLAEEVSQNTHPKEHPVDTTYIDSFTWTFYKLSTIKGSITIRWLGESNGWYSEAVDFYEL